MQLKTILLGAFVATTAFAGPKNLEPPSRLPDGARIPIPIPEGDIGYLDGHMKRELIPGAPGNEFVPNGHGGMVEVNSYYAARYKEVTRLEDMLTSGVGPTGAILDERAKSSILRQLEFLEDSLKHNRGPRKRQLVPGNAGTTSRPASAEAVQGQIEKLENILELGVGPSGVPVDEDVKAAILEEIKHMMKQIVEIRVYESQGLDDVLDKRQLRYLPFPANTDSAMEELGQDRGE